MSFVHYEPDVEAVPCLGCNELVDDADLVRHRDHRDVSTYFWHPYHFWCTARGARQARVECIECAARLAPDAAAAAIRWGATRMIRIRRRIVAVTVRPHTVNDHPEAVVPRPPGLRLVLLARLLPRTEVEPVEWLLDDAARAIEADVRSRYALAHDACPRDAADPWRRRLRDAPADDALRGVYADWLEQRGDAAPAAFVRLAIERRRAPGDAAIAEQLHAAAAELSGSWCRDVVGPGQRALSRA